MNNTTETDNPLPKVEDFLNQPVSLLIQQNDQVISGQLFTHGENFGIQHVAFPSHAVKEIRVIEASPEVNLIRAVFVI